MKFSKTPAEMQAEMQKKQSEMKRQKFAVKAVKNYRKAAEQIRSGNASPDKIMTLVLSTPHFDTLDMPNFTPLEIEAIVKRWTFDRMYIDPRAADEIEALLK